MFRGRGSIRLMVNLEGVISVIPTPFEPDGAVDEKSLRRVVDLYIADGVAGLTALGVTSEVAQLSDRERAVVLETVMDQVKGRVPVVVGASSGEVERCLEYARAAQSAGAAAVMVTPSRPDPADVLRLYATLAETIDLPIVVQDYPPVSGVAMEPELLARIGREIPAARTIKLEDAPTPFKTARILEHAEGVEIRILGGLGGAYLLEELLAGATGAMTGFAYPRILVDVVREFHAGRTDRAAEIFYHHVPLMRFEFQKDIGIAIRKEILRRRGAVAHAGVRAPASELDAPTRAGLDRILSWLDLR